MIKFRFKRKYIFLILLFTCVTLFSYVYNRETSLTENISFNDTSIVKAIKRLDPDTYEQITKALEISDEKMRLAKLLLISRAWAESNIDKITYLSSDKTVVRLGEFRSELFRQALLSDPSGDFCIRLMYPHEVGIPDVKKFSRDFSLKIYKNTVAEEMANSIINNESVSHYTLDEIDALYSKLIDKFDVLYGDLFFNEDIEYIKINKKRYCEMQIKFFEELTSSQEHDAAELLRYYHSNEWPPEMGNFKNNLY